MSQQEVLQRVTAIYQKHNPMKLNEIPYILEKYKGKELQLISNLEKKYNLPPSSTPSSTGTSFGSGTALFGGRGGPSPSPGGGWAGGASQPQTLFKSPSPSGGGFAVFQQPQPQQQVGCFGAGTGVTAHSSLFGGQGASFGITNSNSGQNTLWR
jgi:hypothetical protein